VKLDLVARLRLETTPVAGRRITRIFVDEREVPADLIALEAAARLSLGAPLSPAHLRRLTVVPGITGLWQVTLRGHHDFADMVMLDTQYAENLSFALDVKILVRTVTTVLTGSGSC
jgi:hypothetical protein